MSMSAKNLSVLCLSLAFICPAALGEDPIMRRQPSKAKYRVGLMFSQAGSSAEGLPVMDVVEGGPAAKAGLKGGDVITHLNGKKAGTDPLLFGNLLGEPTPIECQVLRDGATLKLTIVPEKKKGARGTPRRRMPGSVKVEFSPNWDDTHDGVQMSMANGIPMIQAKINGKGPWNFFVDTGASVSLIQTELAETLGLKVVGTEQIGDPSNSTALTTDVVAVDSITIGDKVYRDLELVSFDQPGLFSSGDGPKGVIGIPLFKDSLFTFDYAVGEVRIEEGELPPVNNKDIIPLVPDTSLPTISLTVGEVSMNAHLDTGSPGFISLPNQVESKLKLKSPSTVVGRGRTVNSEFEIRSADLDGDLIIGSHRFETPTLRFISLLDSVGVANVGSALFQGAVLTIDQKNQRLRFTR